MDEQACPPESLLQGYLSRDIAPREHDEVDRHLADCAVCRRLIALWVSRSSETDWRASSAPVVFDADAYPKIGRFEIVGPLGSGAFGTVYEARDPEIDRRIALKVRPGAATNADAMLGEGRALGRVNHPNVVRVYEVGSDGDLFYVAMELVKGQTLRRWVQAAPSWRTIAAVFVQVARGLAAVHQAGLVHRDVKPDNILIDEHDRACLVDFGLARSGLGTTAMGHGSMATPTQRFSEQTDTNETAGTPAYMAPEQLAGAAADRLSDQFSYCVALFEALYGARPFQGESIGQLVEAIARGDIVRPSSGPKVPSWFVALLRRGLAHEPAKRWPSMATLSRALERGLARRRRSILVVATTATLVAATTTGWIAAGAGQAPRCTGGAAQLDGVWDPSTRASVQASIVSTNLAYAPDVWTRVEPQLDAFAQQWVQMHTDACEATTVRGEQSPALMDLQMTCLRRARVDLRAAVDVLLHADADVVPKAHEIVNSLPNLARCTDTDVLEADVPPPPGEQAEAVAEIEEHLARASALRDAGKYDNALQAVQQAQAVLERSSYQPVRAEVELERGTTLKALGKYEAAEEALREALRRSLRWGQWDLVRRSATTLVDVVAHEKANQEGLAYLDLARGLIERSEDSTEHARFLTLVGVILTDQGRYAVAEVEHREALRLLDEGPSPLHFDVGKVRNNLGYTLSIQGRYAEAEVEFREALGALQTSLSPRHPSVASALGNLASVLQAQGKHVEAEARNREALSLLLDALGPEHPDVANVRMNLGNDLNAQGRYADAEREVRRALQSFTKSLGDQHPRVLGLRINLAVTMDSQGRQTEAEQEYRRLLEDTERALGPEHPRLAAVYANLAILLHLRGDAAAAEANYRAALRIHANVPGPEHPDVSSYRHNFGELLLERGKLAEARDLLEQVWGAAQRGTVAPEDRAATAFALARALWASKADRPRARALAEEARQAYADADSDETEHLEALATWVRTHP